MQPQGDDVRFHFLLAAAAALTTHTGSAVAEGSPKGFDCAFARGVASGYEAGHFSHKDPDPLAFGILDVDLEGQSARLAIPGAATAGLRVVRAINANHFLEVVNEGFLNLTTVYDLDEKAGAHPAVHSRHYGVLGAPVFAQYAGFCKPRG